MRFSLRFIAAFLIVVSLCLALIANHRKTRDLEIQIMNLAKQKTQLQIEFIDSLLGEQTETNPANWIFTLKKSLEKNPELHERIRNCANGPYDTFEKEQKIYIVYGAPVGTGRTDGWGPTEVFKFYYVNDKCINVTREALTPW